VRGYRRGQGNLRELHLFRRLAMIAIAGGGLRPHPGPRAGAHHRVRKEDSFAWLGVLRRHLGRVPADLEVLHLTARRTDFVKHRVENLLVEALHGLR
jgi:hypothetical protein